MGVEIRLPQITGATEREQLLQIKSYIYQLREQLQWAFDNIDTTGGSGGGYVVNQTSAYSSSSGSTKIDAEATFAAIKALIIKSADIVDAYYEEINAKLEGVYVAASDFGTFAEKTALDIEANSTAITQKYENIQIIIRDNKEEIEDDLQTIGEDLSFKEQEIITIKGNIEGIDKEITTLEGDVGALDQEMQTTKENFQGTIQTTKETLEGSISSTKQELEGTIDSTKQELNDNIYNNVEAAKGEANAYTDSAKNELSDEIAGAKDELDGKINDANSRINDTNDSVENLGTGLVDANNRIDKTEDEIQKTKDDFNSVIQTVTNSLSEADRLLHSVDEQLKGSIDNLEFDLTGLREIVVGVTAYVKSGLLYYTDAGIPVYGIEIGQEVEANGETAFKKYARFTSEKLSFYDANGNEVAYISDKKLYIGQAEITVSLKVGGLVDLVLSNGDVITKWEGVSG